MKNQQNGCVILWLTWKKYETMHRLLTCTASDYFIMACEFIFCAFICYYYVEEALEIKKHKFSYFFSIWNNLDIIVLLVNHSPSIE